MLPIAAFKCRGPYNKDFCTKSTGPGKKWHPGVMGHQLRGDIVAYGLLAMMKEGIASIQVALEKDFGSYENKVDDKILISPSNHMGKLKEAAIRSLSENSVSINEYLGESSRSEKPSAFRKTKRLLSPPLPQPISCAQAECGSMPRCYTGEVMIV